MVSARALRCGVCILALGTLFFVLPYASSEARTTDSSPSDFASDVHQAVQDAGLAFDTFLARNELAQAEVSTTWDQFGTNSLVNGETSPADISAAVADDVATGVATEQHFDQTEVSYLDSTHSSPEQVAAAENATGSDVPPGETIDPNPSATANPDINFTAAEDIAPEAVASVATESAAPTGIEGGAAGAGTEATAPQNAFDAVVQETINATAGDQTTDNAAGSYGVPTSGASSPDSTPAGNATAAPDTVAAPTGSESSSDSSSGSASGTDSSSNTSGTDTSAGADTSSSDTTSAPSDSGGAIVDSPASAILAATHAARSVHSIFEIFFNLFKPHL